MLRLIDMKSHTLGNAISGLVTLSLALAACTSSEPAQSPSNVASEQAKSANRLDDAAELVSLFRQQIPDSVAMRARCIMVVPSLVTAGLVFGGQSGRGFASCQTPSGWSAPAPMTIRGGPSGRWPASSPRSWWRS